MHTSDYFPWIARPTKAEKVMRERGGEVAPTLLFSIQMPPFLYSFVPGIFNRGMNILCSFIYPYEGRQE